MSTITQFRRLFTRGTDKVGTVVSTGPDGVDVRTRDGVVSMKSISGNITAGSKVEYSGEVIVRKLDADSGLNVYEV